MKAVRPIALPFAVAIAILSIVTEPLQCAFALESLPRSPPAIVIAQTSTGTPDPSPPPPFRPTPAPAPVPPSFSPTPVLPSQPPNQSGSSGAVVWGAIGFTADGSYSSTWKMLSQAEAEAKAAKGCALFGRGGCQVVSFSGQECVALATFIGSYRRRRWNLSFTAGGMTYPDAQNAAIARCNADERSQGRCQPRTAACADGR
jgi:Domain of unknown function (DUF4189)